ncbi:hypothetical protein ACP4OV_011803 [Aristida adscensionis]
MPLRNLARQALKRASGPRASPAAGSRLAASRSASQKNTDYDKAMAAIERVPMICVLSAAASVAIATSAWAYAFGGRRRFPYE